MSPMNGISQRLYNSLPPSLRSVAASGRGYYLRWWRYGLETEGLVDAALERDMWSERQWKTWQHGRLTDLLHRAATKVPYYREYWRRRRRTGDRASWDTLEHWPVLKKDALRATPEAFVAEDCSSRRMLPFYTSGSSGKPLKLWISRTDDRFWYALFEARWRRWYGLSRSNRWAIVAGQLVTPISQRQPPYWVWNRGLNQLYMSSLHIGERTAKDYLNAMQVYEIQYLYCQSAAGALIARFGLEQDLDPPPLKAVITSAEPLFPHQREAISQFFQCPVRATYGMAERVLGASECEAASMHAWPDAGILEVIDDDGDERVPEGHAGRFICTGLVNLNMPLIRYEVGDRGSVMPETTRCSCNRTLPVIDSIDGRLDDVIVTPDGRRVGRLSPAFKGAIAIHEAQVIQESEQLLRVLVVPAQGYSVKDAEAITSNLRDRVGNMQIEIDEVSRIARSATGKFRGVINNVVN